MNFDDKIVKIRERLNLNQGFWTRLPDNLLLLAFIPVESTNLLPLDFRQKVQKEYGHTDYDIFEFMGDAILELIITQLLFEIVSVTTIRNYSVFRQKIVQNLTLYCLMQSKQLCDELITSDPSYYFKECADVFEAILGVLYYFLYYIEANREAFSIIYDWFRRTWNIQSLLDSLLTTGQTNCQIDGRFGPWSVWSPCSNKCGPGLKQRIRVCNNPSPQFGGLPCVGPTNEIQSCYDTSGCPKKNKYKPKPKSRSA